MRRWDLSDDISDEALLAGIAVGDDRAILSFVRRYQRRLYGLSLGILGDSGLAEDVTQEAFIRIFRHAPIFDRQRGSVTSWVLTITRNLAIDSLRSQRTIPTAPEDRIFLSLASSDRGVDESVAASDSLLRARAALAGLPLEQRRAVVMATMHGRTAAEVAQHESIPLGTAKSRIREGLAKLRVTVVEKELT